MKTDVKRIVESQGAPNENDLWLNGTSLKKYQNGQWVEVSSGSDGSTVAQSQADWNQTDDTKADYIKNKPVVPSVIYMRGEIESGTYSNEFNFIPNEDQISFADACDLYLAGYSVMLVFGDGAFYVPVIGYALANVYGEPEVSFYAIYTDGAKIRWFRPNVNEIDPVS